MGENLDANLNDQLPDGRLVRRFYALQDFFLGYFHPDWTLNDRSADAVLNRFTVEAAESVPRVVRELQELLALSLPDDVLERHLHSRYSMNYDPTHDGMTMRQWLEHVTVLLAGPD